MSDPFEPPVSRFGAHSIKWEYQVRDHDIGIQHWDRTDPALGEEQVLPMWVADMDFKAAEPIREALAERLAQGVFGYATKTQDYLDAIVHWQHRRNDWQIDSDWIVPTPGVVPGMHLAVRQFTVPGDKILIQRPVYHPFSFAAENNARIVVNNALQLRDGRYHMDFEDLETKSQDPAVKMAILCSPHNPVGRVWSREELSQFAEICSRNDVLVISDEIHGDLIMPGESFFSYGRLGGAYLDNVIVCTAPSKTFNLAGLMTANFIIANATLRERMQTEMAACGLYTMSPFGIVATQSAYNKGEPWLSAVVEHIASNMRYLEDFLAEHLPAVRLIRPQATYLAWLDFRALNLTHRELDRRCFEVAKIYLDNGEVFGDEGSGFMRMNVACERALLERALVRLKHALA